MRTGPGIAYCKIFPAIGIARLGNSPDEYFVGPEVPGLVADNGRSYKDAQGRVKRQAARFRVYAYNDNDEIVAELTADHPDVAKLTWSVTLANGKAEWHQFAGTAVVAQILAGGAEIPRRNAAVQGDDRTQLVIGPATDRVAGNNQQSKPLEGRFLSNPDPVYLGELRTDEAGRLLVLGGRGESGSVVADNPLAHYANNDSWYDDTSDGPVTATVTLASGASLPVRGRAWVIVAPPHFSPHTHNVVTLDDVMAEAALEHNLAWPVADFGPRPSNTDPVSFTRDVYPILRRLTMYQWVSDRARRGHSAGKRGDFLNPDVLRTLADPKAATQPHSPHRRIFERVRKPLLHPPTLGTRPPTADELDPTSQDAINQANLSFMPPLAGDEGDVTHPLYGDKRVDKGAPSTWLSVTARQYRTLARWQAGDFAADWTGAAPAPPHSIEAIPLPEQPAALTRASLEVCQGGAFFPGIEITSIVRFASFYSEAFRVSDAYAAGDITRWMAVPWQADFYECRDHWWPAIRPDDVVPDEEYERILGEFQEEATDQNLSSLLVARRPWARGLALLIPPRPGLPDPASGQNAAGYQTLCQRQLAKFAGSYLNFVPAPFEGEIAGLYFRRLQNFLEQTVVTPGRFTLPPVDENLQAYYNRVRELIRTFLADETSVPDPKPDEELADYAGRLADVAVESPVWQGLFDVQWRRRVRHQGKNDLVANWSRLGFVVPRQTPYGETVYVEGDRGRYDLLGFRDYFYYLMNLENYPDFYPKARELADEYMRLAWELEPALRQIPAFEEYGFFQYDSVTFQARLEKIYEKQRRDAEAYNPVTGEGEPLFRTAPQVVERIRQLAPFNQLDGSWLEKIAQAGPSTDIHGYLFEIWSDEIGNGDPAQNHANIYTDLLRSAGIYLPPLASRAYADNPEIWDSSFSSPVYQTAVAQFPETYFPELLGMTLYLEWEAVYLPAMVKLYEYHGYNPLFYKLHVAIDNPVYGHGARARDAVARYLDQVREESGEREMQEHWRRVWNGYLAFRFIGGGDWQYYFTNPPTLVERVMAMFEQKRHFAQLNHGRRRLGPNFLNDWFDEVPDFMTQLVQSDLITPGDAKNSSFFDVISFTGPMLKVFSPQDKELLAEWINSLPPAPLGGALDAGQAMRVLLSELCARGMAVPDHGSFLLTGSYVDPAQPDQEQQVTKPVNWWFQIDQPDRFMAALRDPANGWIVPGNVADSRFVRELLSPPRRMARFLIQTMPEIGDKSAREVIIEWIEQGCPIPERPPLLRATAIPARPNVRADAPHLAAQQTEPLARQIQLRSAGSVPLTPTQHRGLRHRFYGPGGGACH
ncbi:MAG: LodA/GoxA family CTQ-dependent oxidase [Pseudonocardiaceae bacterium]